MATSGLFPANKLPSIDLARLLGIKDPIDFQALSDQFDCLRNFERVGIIYDDGYSRWLVRPSRRYASITNNVVTHVVITKIRENTSSADIEKSLTDTLSTSIFNGEFAATALACGSSLATAVLAVTATGVIPLTGGSSGIAAVTLATGTWATGFQCGIGVGRAVGLSAGFSEEVKWLDSQQWFQTTSTILDGLSLTSASVGLKKTVDVYKQMKAISSIKATEWLKLLPRAERKRLTDHIIRAQNPGISASGIKAAINVGKYPKRFPAESLQRSLHRELVSAIINSSAFVGSGLSGNLRNPANISSHGKYIVSLMQSF